MTKSVDALYRDYLNRADGDPSEADYLALHQGREGTSRRHQEVLKVLDFQNAAVLDIACGTGLILDEIVEAGQRPSLYIGTDLLPERMNHISQRLGKYGIPGGFYATPPGVSVTDVIDMKFDVAIAVGLCGFEGFATPIEIEQLIRTMQLYAPSGCVTVPGLVEGRGQATGYCQCYRPQELMHDINDSSLHVVDWGWDFLIYW